MKYKRLTTKDEEGNWQVWEDDYSHPFEALQVAIDRLAELEDKMENGTLIELPCKVGTKINKLSFISVDYIKTKEESRTYYILRCDCGNIKSIRKDLWESGNTKGCGCLYNKHNQAKGTHTRIYEIYNGMKKRCYNAKHKSFRYYGGKNITIHNEWLGENGFINFYDWAIKNGYREDLTIDRIDSKGNYEPSNCRWVTMKEQHKNTSKVLPIQIIETGEIFESISSCAKVIGASGGNISRCISTGKNTCKGYHFKKLTREEAESKLKELQE